MCVCRSIRPGTTVSLPRFTTRASAGTVEFASPTDAMRSPSMTITAFVTAFPVPSTTLPARTTVVAAVALVTGNMARTSVTVSCFISIIGGLRRRDIVIRDSSPGSTMVSDQLSAISFQLTVQRSERAKHFRIGEVRVPAARVWEDEHRGALESLSLRANDHGQRRGSGEHRAIERDADKRDDARAPATDFPPQDALAFRVLAGASASCGGKSV